MPCVITRDPKTGKRNVGCYRLQVYDKHTTGFHAQRQKVAAEHYREALRASVGARVPARATTDSATARAGTLAPRSDFPRATVDIMARTSGGQVLAEHQPSGKMEVAVAIGTDPALTFSAIVPAPPNVARQLEVTVSHGEHLAGDESKPPAGN